MTGGQDWAAELIDTSGGGAMSEAKRLSDVRLARIRQLVDSGHSSDVARDLLAHADSIEAELAAAKAECDRLRKLAKQFAEANTKLRRIACHVPGRVWMTASEECGYGNTVSINDHKIDEAWLEFTSVKPKEP